MSKIVNNATLGYLGTDYQIRLVKCFIEDQQFFVSLYEIIDQNMFTDEHLRRIVGLMKDRYASSSVVPTYLDLDVLIRSKVSDTIAVNQNVSMLNKIREMPFDAIDLIKEEAEKFFKQQNLTKALNKATDIIKKGNAKDYYIIEDIIKKALETNTKQDMGFRLFENVEGDLKDDYRQTISTGCQELDESLYGGLGKKELGLIIAPMGVGKAQPLSSKVLTPNGFKTMGEIEIGDKVIGRDGKSYSVTGVFPQGIRPIYKITFSNGRSCECDIEHLWNVNTYWQRTRKTYVKGSGVKNMKREFNPDYSFKTMTLREIIDKGLYKTSKSGKISKVFRIPNNEKVEFIRQEVIINPYLLGYYIGDGCYSRSSITIGNNDYEEVYEILSNMICDKSHFTYNKKRNIWELSLNGEDRQNLKELVGCCKSEDKKIPETYLHNSIEVRMSLLQGLMDSDGCVSKSGLSSFSTKSKILAENVMFLVRSLGGNAYLSEKNTFYKDKMTNKKIDCGVSYRISISFHDETVKPFRLERKSSRVKYRTKYIDNIYIENVEYIRDEEAQCIMVDSDEHLYITDDFIVTHNTSITTGFAASAATTLTEYNNFQGFKVLHFFFEDEEVNIRRKYYGYMLDIDACTLSDPAIKPEAVRRLNEDSELKQMLKKNIISHRLSTGEVTASEIKNIIKKYIAFGFKPDLVIIDYFECLKSEKSDSSNDSEWSREGVTMRKLETICKEMDVAMWVPVQGTKGSIGQEIVTLAHAGGSVKKTQIGHIVIQLAQTDEQKERGRLSLFIGKLRAAKIGRTQFKDVLFNNGTCKFDMTDLDNTEPLYNDNGISNSAQSIAKSVKQEYRKNR